MSIWAQSEKFYNFWEFSLVEWSTQMILGTIKYLKNSIPFFFNNFIIDAICFFSSLSVRIIFGWVGTFSTKINYITPTRRKSTSHLDYSSLLWLGWIPWTTDTTTELLEYEIGSRRWNWKFWEKHFWNPNPDFLLHSSYSFWP